MTRTYPTLTSDEAQQIAQGWGDERLERHVDRWLSEHGFGWDPSLTDDDNRAQFADVVGLVRDTQAAGFICCSCLGSCLWAEDAWVCPKCGDEWPDGAEAMAGDRQHPNVEDRS